MNISKLAAEICMNVGREFPDRLSHRGEMVLRQLSSLVEEAIELDESVRIGGRHGIMMELADCTLTPYMVAHYAEIDLEHVVRFFVEQCVLVDELPYCAAGRAMKAGRRYLEIARSVGNKDQFAGELARVVLSVRTLARTLDFDLDHCIKTKADIIFSRGWRENVG